MISHFDHKHLLLGTLFWPKAGLGCMFVWCLNSVWGDGKYIGQRRIFSFGIKRFTKSQGERRSIPRAHRSRILRVTNCVVMKQHKRCNYLEGKGFMIQGPKMVQEKFNKETVEVILEGYVLYQYFVKYTLNLWHRCKSSKDFYYIYLFS